MAETAVQLLWQNLASLIAEEGKLLGGFAKDVDDIKDELETMKAFLQDADSRGETDQTIKTWVKQVRGVACDIEDLLDEVLLRLVRPHKQGFFDTLLHKLHDITHLKTRHHLATKIRAIKAKLKNISERRQTFPLTRANTTPWYDPRIASLYIDEAEVVGIEEPKSKLITWLTEEELKLTIISVVGMGGLGKTTLVKKVYDCQTVNEHFNHRVWITVSNSPVIGELLRTAIKGVWKAAKELDAMNTSELIEVLKNQLLKKRYLIIFDDIWHINVWEAMKYAFPNCDCGSRIIFTTRKHEVAAACSSNVHVLELLKEQEAWRLFCMKAFGTSHDSSSGCPEELEELSRNILKKCSGLPLAIVLIGGLLVRKAKTVWEWKNVYDSLGAEMRNNHELESLSRILLLSYNNLPSYIKPCFLYLSMFPEDYLVKPKKMIKLWIAEGFVEEKQGVTMEVVARGYINELISRSMIQVAELRDDNCNEVKSCRIHDLMLDIIQIKCKEECFSTTFINRSQVMRAELHDEKARRISIFHDNTGDQNYSYPIGSRCSHIRSLMIFQLDDESPPKSLEDKFLCAFRLLRVLDLEGADIVEFPPELVELIHLRYLSLRNTKITMLPKSIGKLQNLETLDLRKTGVSKLPAEILKLQRLRHLLVYHQNNNFDKYGVSVPTGISKLTSLQKLPVLDFQQERESGIVAKELGKLTQLRKLSITNLRREDGRDLCLCLQKMEHLHTVIISTTTRILFIYAEDVNKEEKKEFLELESLMSPPQLLSRLYLIGHLMRLPVWIASLRNLTFIVLFYSRLSSEDQENDPLKAFQHMPNLVHLHFRQAYQGEELCCNEVRGYKNLKILNLYDLKGLKRVRFIEGSMPMLRELTIWDCPVLEMVPHGIEHLSGLQELTLCEVNPELVERIRRKRKISPSPSQRGEAQAEGEGEDCWRVQHIPTIHHTFHNTKETFGLENL